MPHEELGDVRLAEEVARLDCDVERVCSLLVGKPGIGARCEQHADYLYVAHAARANQCGVAVVVLHIDGDLLLEQVRNDGGVALFRGADQRRCAKFATC